MVEDAALVDGTATLSLTLGFDGVVPDAGGLGAKYRALLAQMRVGFETYCLLQKHGTSTPYPGSWRITRPYGKLDLESPPPKTHLYQRAGGSGKLLCRRGFSAPFPAPSPPRARWAHSGRIP